jgi:uncharacterized protein YndB with AHSA1/START domain
MTSTEPEWIELRPVGLEFLDTASMRVDIEITTSLSQETVWKAFVDPTTWKSWFPGVVEADYLPQDRPFGVGSIRTANVEGQLFEETILAWDEPYRWTYRIDRCTAELASAQVESTELAAHGDGGTMVRWILASDPCEGLLLARDILPEILERRLSEALRNLERLEDER